MTTNWQAAELTWNQSWSHIEGYQLFILAGLCAAALLIFIFLLMTIGRLRRLGRRVDALQLSVEKLNNTMQMRFIKELHDQSKNKTPAKEA